MLTHAQIWSGIDRLAHRAGLTPSGLARRAGLDPTTFNPSKRASADGAKGYAMQLAPGVLVNLVSGERLAATRWSGPRQVSAMAGIGNPERFFSTLEALAFECETYVFADHARYDEQMLAALPANRPVLMTEKDAVKCTGLARGNWWYLSVDAQLSEDFAAALLTLLPAAPQKGREPIQE